MSITGQAFQGGSQTWLSRLAALTARLTQREAELRESEGFLRSVLSATADKVKVLDARGILRFINSPGLRFLGLDAASKVVGREWAELWPEEERPRIRAVVASVLAAGAPQRFESFCKGASGNIHWWDVVVTPLLNEKEPPRLVVVSRDVTDRHLAEERQTLLAREVDHRAKNALAVALALVRLAPRDNAEQFASGIEGRIASMARAHSLLAKGRWDGADLRLLAEGELAAYSGRIILTGPPVRLAADAAQPIAMLLHELTTNAAKYGALTRPEGRLEVSWDFDGAEGALRLHWLECGGPPISSIPTKRGFGSRLLTQIAERQLDGRMEWDWSVTGLHLSLYLKPRSATPAPVQRTTEAVSSPEIAREAIQSRENSVVPFEGPPQVLVVEDEFLLSLELEAALRSMGCEVVGPARTLSEAISLATSEPVLHAAILDVNLSGEIVFPAADLLVARGVPIFFATGYTSAESLRGREATAVAVLRKPYAPDVLALALSKVFPSESRAQ